MPPTLNPRSIVPHAGGAQLIADGTSFSMVASEWKRIDMQLMESLHLQGVHIAWINAQVGDYGWLSLINPAGDSSPSATVEVDATSFTVDAGKGTHYDPASGALSVEFWDTNDDLIEIARIDSVTGDVITLSSGVKNQYLTSSTFRVCMAQHTVMRGTNSIDGGMRFLGTSHDVIDSANQMTVALPSGLVLGARFRTSVVVGTRDFTVNYKMRRPE